LRVPVAHGEGCYYADKETLDELEKAGQVLFRYVHDDGTVASDPDDAANPNGSLRGIAGVCNSAGNVAGLMPHPERMSESVMGNDGGMQLIRSLIESASDWEKAGRPAPKTTEVGAGR
jgi:phosphoribosylformylglycinamidine synthase